MNCVSHGYSFFVRQIKTTYLLKLDAPRAFTRASYRNIKSYFTSIEHNKNEESWFFPTSEVSSGHHSHHSSLFKESVVVVLSMFS